MSYHLVLSGSLQQSNLLQIVNNLHEQRQSNGVLSILLAILKNLSQLLGPGLVVNCPLVLGKDPLVNNFLIVGSPHLLWLPFVEVEDVAFQVMFWSFLQTPVC